MNRQTALAQLDTIKLKSTEAALQRHKAHMDDLIKAARKALKSGKPEMCEELHLFGRRVKIELL